MTFRSGPGIMCRMTTQYPKQVEKLDAEDFGERWQLREGSFLNGVHLRADCVPPCPLHHASEHSMDDAPLIWRGDRGIFERQCEHGVGHPDPDTMDYIAIEKGDDAAYWESIHGCDGCCYDPDRKARQAPDMPEVEKPKPAPTISLEQDPPLGFTDEQIDAVIMAVVHGGDPEGVREDDITRIAENFEKDVELAQITLSILDLIMLGKVVLSEDENDPEGWKAKAQDWVMPE